ncbi:MAG: sensor histidine kinase [Ktedonobacteraceae bacterium]
MRAGDPNEVHQLSKISGISPYLLWLVWITWLPFLISPISTLIQARPVGFVVVLCGIALFVAVYLWATWQNVRRLIAALPSTKRTEITKWLTIAVFFVLCVVLVHLGRVSGIELTEPFIFTSAYIGGRLPMVRAVQASIALILIVLIGGRLTGFSWTDLIQGVFLIIVVNFTTICLVRLVTVSQELRRAREEIARLAVMTERLRIARDLHDLLGHNLSLIALKSELAGRLLKVAPERAATEIGDVEQAARATLQEVREALASYRQPMLASELHAAQEILAAAGIEYRYEGNENLIDALPPAIEAALSWTVREGVTNVIKHSCARQCLIRVTRNKKAVSIEIIDNGTTAEDAAGSGGNGLHGLSERVAALGGQFQAGPRAGCGFRVAVSIPLARRNDEAVTRAQPAPAANSAVSMIAERSEQL